jgi:hypothetical protein
MNCSSNKAQQKPPQPSISIPAPYSNPLEIFSEGIQERIHDFSHSVDNESQSLMFSDPPHEEDDKQSIDEQSDQNSSLESETETTTSCNYPNVLAQLQDYKNDINPEQSSQTDFTRIDQSFRQRYINYVTNEKGAATITTTYRSDVELLHLLQKSNVPIKMYDEIQKWARKSYAINPKVYTRANLTRTKALQVFEKNFDAKGCKPISVVCRLPSLNHPVTIQTFDFISAVYSLLTDPVLMREENLDLDFTGTQDTNPLHPFPKPAMYTAREKSFVYKEFSDGELYCIAYNTYCRAKQPMDARHLHVPLIIIGQLDKTFIDSKGKLTLEPFKISLHIFKEQVRRRDFAWRPLGYICNQANLPNYKCSADKARDYHYMVHQILKSMKDYQKQFDFFLWDMILQQSKVHIAFHPVFGYIIGDNEGHDKLVGRFLNRMYVHHLCQYCDTPINQSDNPFYMKWKHTHAIEISNLVSKREVHRLKEMSYNCFENGFCGIKFADPIRGINGATPAERLHLLNHGLFQLILEYNFGQKRAKAVKKTIRTMLPVQDDDLTEDDDDTENTDETDGEEEDSNDNSLLLPETNESDVEEEESNDNCLKINDDQTFSKFALFSQTICGQFDRDAKEYGRFLQKQSCHYWKRSFFYQGITSNSKKVGHEERNCLLLCLLIYTSSCYEYYSSMLDPEKGRKRKKGNKDAPRQTKRLDFLIELLSETLNLEEFMMQKSIPKSTLILAQNYIPLYLQFLKEVCPRESGMGWKLTKFHIILHLVDDIKRMSIPLNYDGNVVESHHKKEKKSGKRTQMRASLLDKHTANKRAEEMLIEKAYNAFHPPKSLFNSVDIAVEDVGDTPNADGDLSAKKLAYSDGVGLCFTNAKGNVSKKVNSMHDLEYLIHQINDFFKKFFENTMLPDTGVGVFTRLKMLQETDCEPDGEMDGVADTVLYRGDPFWTNNRGTFNTCDPWHDFAYIEWRTSLSDRSEDVTVIPGRILFFFKIPENCQGQDPENENLVYPTGSYALIQSCVEDLNANPPTSTTANEYYREKYQTNSNLPTYLAHPSCSILCWTMMELTKYTFQNKNGTIEQTVPKLYVVSTSSICGSCLAVPYNLRQQPYIEWIVVRNRDQWGDTIVDDMEERLRHE